MDVTDIVAADGSRLSTLDRGSYWMPTILSEHALKLGDSLLVEFV